jgi:hypothetical protein
MGNIIERRGLGVIWDITSILFIGSNTGNEINIIGW